MRVTNESLYRRLLSGLSLNQRRMVRAQEQVASGRRLVRPSDDPTGTSRVLTLERELADARRVRESITLGRTFVDTAMSSLQEGTGLLSEARALMIQGMNGTVDPQSRIAIADQIDLLRLELLEIANRKSADRFLFAGSATGTEPFEANSVGGYDRVSYSGDDATQELRIGGDVTVGLNIPGTEAFAKLEPAGVTFAGLTGLGVGTTASEGTSWETVTITTTAVDLGALASVGVTSAGGADTILQTSAIAIDAASQTIALGNGQPVPIPKPTSPGAQALTLVDEFGAQLVLDVSGWNGADYSGQVDGQGTIRLGDGDPIALDFGATDQRLEGGATGTVLHVDLTGVRSSGEDVAQFAGAVNVFDLLAGVSADLRNDSGLPATQVNERMNLRLTELDRHFDNVLVAGGILGSRTQRLETTEGRMANAMVQISGLLSNVEDADFTEVVMDLQRAESTLQLTQATGTRLIQRTLLDFIR